MLGIIIVLVLMVMGGLIAFLGDKIGSKVGKKRLTLFGLRPKYTSIIVTIKIYAEHCLALTSSKEK